MYGHKIPGEVAAFDYDFAFRIFFQVFSKHFVPSHSGFKIRARAINAHGSQYEQGKNEELVNFKTPKPREEIIG